LILLEESKDSNLSSEDPEIQKEQLPIFNVRNEPVMLEAINVITLLGKSNKAILRAKGNSIPNAVAIANIITEKMLKGNSKIQNIVLDTDMPAGIGKMLSTIEIVLLKN
jgi:DNA-binding protein